MNLIMESLFVGITNLSNGEEFFFWNHKPCYLLGFILQSAFDKNSLKF